MPLVKSDRTNPLACVSTLGEAPAGSGNNSPDPAGHSRNDLLAAPAPLSTLGTKGAAGKSALPSATKRDRLPGGKRPTGSPLEKRVRFALNSSVRSHRETRPTSVGISRVIRQGRVRPVGDDRPPAMHRMLRVCSAVRHSCLAMHSYSMRRGHKLNPDPEVSALRASVLEGARDQKAHACVDRGGVHWSPHYAL